MEPEGSLLHSQVPATCPYPEPTQSSPYSNIPLPEDLLLHKQTENDRWVVFTYNSREVKFITKLLLRIPIYKLYIAL